MEPPVIESLDDLVAAIDALERAQARVALAAAELADAWAGDRSLWMAAWRTDGTTYTEPAPDRFHTGPPTSRSPPGEGPPGHTSVAA